jgi:DNA-binding NtrC family response regulator
VDAFARDWIEGLMARHHGDLNEVARESGLPKAELQKQLKKWGAGEKPSAPPPPPAAPATPSKRAAK